MASSAITEPGYDDVVAAAARLAGRAVRTPLLTSAALDERAGGRLLIKAECLQRSGSFKFRGAYNRIALIAPAQRTKGVVAFSSGNHAQAVALVAKLFAIPATIVMPADAPAVKIDMTRAHGARIVLYDRDGESREAIAAKLVAESGASLIPPYDDPGVIAGQGTAGIEIADDVAALGLTLDVALVPCSGGGLVGGTALALTRRFPGIAVYAVEPEGFDDTTLSLRTGVRASNAPGSRTICDALMVREPGEITLQLNARLLAGGIVVSDAEAQAAVAAAFRHLKLVLEPSGAIALAAALAGQFDCRGKTVSIMASGGNVDADTFCRAIAKT